MSDNNKQALDVLQECINDVDGCEINMSNYGEDDVSAINNAYVLMFGAMENAITVLKSQSTQSVKQYPGCKCDFKSHMVGDGCDECVPEQTHIHDKKILLLNKIETWPVSHDKGDFLGVLVDLEKLKKLLSSQNEVTVISIKEANALIESEAHCYFPATTLMVHYPNGVRIVREKA